MKTRNALAAALFVACLCHGQTPVAPPPATEPGPLKIDLADAIARARRFGLPLQGAQLAAALAREDVKQIRAARLPAVNMLNQYLYTEGNGTPEGVFVANNGVHVYTEQAQVHEEILSLARRGELRVAIANEAAARARVTVAQRGLTYGVVQAYYALIVAQRKLDYARTSLTEAERFVDLTRKQENAGEVSHVDTIKAQIQLQQRQRELSDAELNIEKAKIGLGVYLFPQLREDFTVVDDLESAPALAPIAEVESVVRTSSPEIEAAQASLRAAQAGVSVARYAYLPSLSFDFFYGLNSNVLAWHLYDPEPRRNVGYAAEVTLNIPVWNWGITRSRITQAELRRQQAELDLALTRRTLNANLETAYREARVAQAQLASLRSSLTLAEDNLRLTLLRYTAGESTSLEVVDAQSTLTQARNALADGLSRYRVALATVQTLTGTL
jgi:outer membrane protein TolC